MSATRYSCVLISRGTPTFIRNLRVNPYRFHPLPEQAAERARTFGCVRLVCP
ncbi:helix-turn-helix domain-containing protein [Microbispora sp. NPDC046933]|uniref:helix-turn-helix domain-containing protein n=1 Tax=Microbispora sp. NPDC046933 TaxID=3155618 RepID=UPI0034118F48